MSDAGKYERYAMIIAGGGSAMTGTAAVLASSLLLELAVGVGVAVGLVVGGLVWWFTRER